MDILMYVLIGLMIVWVAFQAISGRKKNKQRQELLNSMGPGTKIVTIGGIYGEIRNITADNKIVVNVGPADKENLVVFDKQSIRNVISGFAANAVSPSSAPAEEKKEESKEEKKSE
ncbi:MAG: preprotein translocase subunit YajC [Clostridiales bacterium]|jgi:preprotein translocase subunit YajC|nr:preprotein translocase subunit YajC [Clostridiales bacterium]